MTFKSLMDHWSKSPTKGPSRGKAEASKSNIANNPRHEACGNIPRQSCFAALRQMKEHGGERDLSVDAEDGSDGHVWQEQQRE